jgi:hypothetical protein
MTSEPTDVPLWLSCLRQPSRYVALLLFALLHSWNHTLCRHILAFQIIRVIYSTFYRHIYTLLIAHLIDEPAPHPSPYCRLGLDIRLCAADVLLKLQEVGRELDVVLEVILCVEIVCGLVTAVLLDVQTDGRTTAAST